MLYGAPLDPISSAQIASLRARVTELEAELAALRAAAELDGDLLLVSQERAALA
jgi:hypothetical protein